MPQTADLLVVGTPIAHGSYTGLLKHLLDLLAGRALAIEQRSLWPPTAVIVTRWFWNTRCGPC
jgi:NAD(P)H-dependent FMN reductase